MINRMHLYSAHFIIVLLTGNDFNIFTSNPLHKRELIVSLLCVCTCRVDIVDVTDAVDRIKGIIAGEATNKQSSSQVSRFTGQTND